MNILKSTLESFKENELSKMRKLNVYGGVANGGTPPPVETILDPNFDGSGNGDDDPVYGTGPRSTGGGGAGSATSVATLGNPYGGSIPTIGG